MPEKIQYMLDTNTVSYIIKGQPKAIRERLVSVPMADIYISAITEAELLLGVAKKPEAKRLSTIVNEFLLRVQILHWGSSSAKTYAELRTSCEREGKALGNMDMLIAAHAKAEAMVLVTSDKAFYKLEHMLKLENWAEPLY